MLLGNVSDTIEVAYDTLMTPMVFEPQTLIPEALARRLRGVPACIQQVGSLVDILRSQPNATIQMVRWGGLGDVCMMVPALRELQRRFPDATFRVDSSYGALFAADPTLAMRHGQADHKLLLDHWLELDHTGDPEFSTVSRVDLYGRAVGVKLAPPVSWELPLLKADEHLAEELVQTSAQPTIAVQLKGNAPHRSIGPKLIGPLVDAVRAVGRMVILDKDRGFGPTGDGIVNLAGRTTPRQAIAVLKRCDAALTMESGVFWLAHLAKVPTVCFFGPTRPQERIWHHPLHPKGIRAILMNELLDPVCPPCWGNGGACDSWRQKVAWCMNDPDPQLVTRLVTEALHSVMG